MPKDLIDLCATYYVETEKVVIQRTIELFQCHSYDEGVMMLVRKRSPPSLRPGLSRLIEAVRIRGQAYLWWFQMRSALPSFIPLGNVNMKIRKTGARGCCFKDENGKVIADIFYRFGRTGFGLNDYETAGHPIAWSYRVADAIPYLDVVGPYLNLSTVTLERLQMCSVELQARNKESHDIWLPRLFELFKGLIALQLWSSDLETFEETEFQEDSICAQMVSANAWNEFYEKYQFGEGIPYCC